MKTIIYYSLASTLWLLSMTYSFSQENEAKTATIEQLENKKEEVVTAEKQALKQEIELINKRFDNEEITAEEVETLKKAAAEKHALNIENKLAILDNQILLLKRNFDLSRSLENSCNSV
jgi:DNA-binding protein H-NS